VSPPSAFFDVPADGDRSQVGLAGKKGYAVSVIRVHPDSIRDYANHAQESFTTIRASLEQLVNDVVNVRYFGPNAIEFKTRSGEMAADFANRLSQDLGAIADAVRASTTNIAASLGGVPIAIQVNGTTIVPPAAPVGDGAVDVDVSGLENLRAPVRQRFEAINAEFDDHLRRLQGTDWVGAAKDTAVTNVSGFTTAAKSKATEAQTAITKYLDDQINAVLAADR